VGHILLSIAVFIALVGTLFLLAHFADPMRRRSSYLKRKRKQREEGKGEE